MGQRTKPDRKNGPARHDEATVTLAPAELGAKSVLVKLAPDGSLDGVGGVGGVGLGEIERQLEPLPPAVAEVRTGPDKYQVLKTLGEGGMGKVYAVLDRDLKRPVALKMILGGGEPGEQRRFLEEARVMAQLQHPNILPVHELGLTEGRKLYYTMPLVRGRSLKAVLDALRSGDAAIRRTYSLTRLVQVFLQVAQAIGYAHDRGVLHRDLKPGNVMLGEHGEVQVIDWGLAKVGAGAEVRTDVDSSLTRRGHVIGTPAYMSPEQARGEEADARTDVYALGAMLYEVLTQEAPFQGPSADVLAAVVRDAPVPPRERARDRAIPGELERACLKALSKRPDDRQPSVEALHAEVQAWLETEAERTRRHERAEGKAAEGEARLAEYRRLKQEVRRLDAEAEATARRLEPWRPAEEKAELTALEDRRRGARHLLVEAAADAVGALEKALGFEDENEKARGLLADYYWERLLEADAAGSGSDVEFFGRRVAAYHDGRYARELEGAGSLALRSDPPGAEVRLYRFVERGFVLAAEEERELGETPLRAQPLAMGSYLAVLRKPGYRDGRYPLLITRNRAWSGEVRLFADEEIGRGFVHVPAGPFVRGGDADAWNALERSEPWVDDFFIAEHPVTAGEYLEFLDHLAGAEGLEAARRRAPRLSAQGPTYLVEDGAGRLRLPEVDAEGDRWDPRQPVIGISWLDAVAYGEWRSRREGRDARLPSESEWEKAARGVDGRWFPWGNRFDPSLCNMRDSRRERTAPVAVDEFPSDASVYGVRGMAGNVRDWTSSEEVEGSGPHRRVGRVCRGGLWDASARSSRAAYRYPYEPGRVSGGLGFRLARSP